MTIGERIRTRRISLEMTIDELSEKLGKNRATVYRYENNDIENLPVNIVEPLAKALHTTPAYLMGWEDDKSMQTEKSSPIPVSLEILISKLDKENLAKLQMYAKKLLDLQELENE